jgi:hypothetical protein
MQQINCSRYPKLLSLSQFFKKNSWTGDKIEICKSLKINAELLGIKEIVGQLIFCDKNRLILTNLKRLKQEGSDKMCLIK